MKIKKIIIVSILGACLMTGCATNPIVGIYDNNKEIVSDSNSFNLDKVEQTIDEEQFIASVEKMEGMDTIWSYSLDKDDTLDITYTIKIYSGKLKLVLITPNGEATTIVECDFEMDEPVQSTLNVQAGKNRIKIVAGENTKFDINVSIPQGEFQKIGF